MADYSGAYGTTYTSSIYALQKKIEELEARVAELSPENTYKVTFTTKAKSPEELYQSVRSAFDVVPVIERVE